MTLERQLQKEIVPVRFADEDEIWEEPGMRQAAEDPEEGFLAEAQPRRDMEEGVAGEEALQMRTYWPVMASMVVTILLLLSAAERQI